MRDVRSRIIEEILETEINIKYWRIKKLEIEIKRNV